MAISFQDNFYLNIRKKYICTTCLYFNFITTLMSTRCWVPFKLPNFLTVYYKCCKINCCKSNPANPARIISQGTHQPLQCPKALKGHTFEYIQTEVLSLVIFPSSTGIIKGDEIMVINGAIVSDLDMMYIESVLQVRRGGIGGICWWWEWGCL